MKKGIKLAALLAAVTLVFAALVLTVGAEEGAQTEIDTTGASFIISNAAGEIVGSGKTAGDFQRAFKNAEDGTTIKLLKTLDITDTGGITIESMANNPREISLDLAGNGIYSHLKFVMFATKNYSTLNVYSSVPGGYVYNNSSRNNDLSHSGANFTAGGASATVNLGRYDDGTTVHSGYNLSSYSSAIADASSGGSGNFRSRINLIEGNYFSVLSDYTGALITRGNNTDIYAKDANIILTYGSFPINSAVAGEDATITLEDCILIGEADETKPLFNNLGGLVTFKNLITNYPLAVQTTTSDARREQSVLILGECVFSARTPMLSSIIASDEEITLGRVSYDYELIGGGRSIQYYPNIETLDKSGNMIMETFELPKLDSASVITAPDNVYPVIWSHDDGTLTENWCYGVEIEAPASIILPDEFEEGVWKFGWIMGETDEGTPIYTVGRCLELDIMATVAYDGDGVIYTVIIPAYLIDEGRLLFDSTMINGDSYGAKDWVSVEIDGEEYYYTETPMMSDEDVYTPLKVLITCDYEVNGKSEMICASYELRIEDYANYILGTEADGVYTEEDYEYARTILEELFPEIPDDDVLIPDDEEILPDDEEE